MLFVKVMLMNTNNYSLLGEIEEALAKVKGKALCTKNRAPNSLSTNHFYLPEFAVKGRDMAYFCSVNLILLKPGLLFNGSDVKLYFGNKDKDSDHVHGILPGLTELITGTEEELAIYYLDVLGLSGKHPDAGTKIQEIINSLQH